MLLSTTVLIGSEDPSEEPLNLRIPERNGYPDSTSMESAGLEKSPLFSMLRSALLPGWGQFYTGHPYRGSLIFTIEGFLWSFAWIEDRRADRSWENYERTGDPRHLDEYDEHFQQGRNYVSLAIAGLLLNIADAYVSANLYGFEGKITFDEEKEEVDLSMRWRFH